MKPMTLREVAESDRHARKSTISRVTSNKYLLSDRGLYELKYFFGSGVASAAGDGAAAEAVKAAIKQLIDAEDEDPKRRCPRRASENERVRHCSSDGCEISRGNGDRIVNSETSLEEDRALASRRADWASTSFFQQRAVPSKGPNGLRRSRANPSPKSGDDPKRVAQSGLHVNAGRLDAQLLCRR